MLNTKNFFMGLCFTGLFGYEQIQANNPPTQTETPCQPSEQVSAPLTFHANFNLTPETGKISFLMPSGGILQLAPEQLIGKPYFLAVFEGGFNQGVDLDLQRYWGEIPQDLNVTYTFPEAMEHGPYDVAFIVYNESPLTEEDKLLEFPPAPRAGELSAFTLSQDQVLEGDPGFANGVIRVNLSGCGSSLTIDNKADEDDLLNSFNDTILVVP